MTRLLTPTDGGARYRIGHEWAQGRTAFGGATAAIMCDAALARASSGRNLLSFSVNFCGPITTGQPVEITVEPLKCGKTLEQYAIRARQDGQLCAHAVAVFASAITSSIRISANIAPIRPQDAAILDQPLAQGIDPQFAANFDFRFYKGAPLYSGSTGHEHLVGLSFKTPLPNWSLAHLVCLMDASPPTQAQQLQEYHPLSTAVWNMHFLPDAYSFDFADGIVMSSVGEASIDGSNYISERVWANDGTPLAFSTQTVLIFG